MKLPKVILYRDELNDEFSDAHIETKKIDKNWAYAGTPLRPLGRAFFYHIVAKPIAYAWLKVKYGHKIINKQALRPFRKKAWFVYGNHTNPSADAYVPTMLDFTGSTYVLVHPNNVSMPVLGHITPSLGAVPLPDDLAAYRNFNAYIDQLLKKNRKIAIYPEKHIWPFYTDIRPFENTSFNYPVTAGAPVFCFTNTYQKRKHRKTPRMVTYVEGPFYPDDTVSRREAVQKLRDEVYAAMKKNAAHSNAEVIHYEQAPFDPDSKSDCINVLFSGNSGVFDGVLTCMLSILRRTKDKRPFNFYVMTMDCSRVKDTYTPVSELQCDFLERAAREYNPQNRVIRLDVTDIYEREFAHSPNEQCYCSPYTLLRLFMDLIPGIPEKILYLDVDIMFNRDITQLYDINVNGFEYAAARDHYGKYLLNHNYINAGVLLFNMLEVRRTGLLRKARDLIRTKKLMFADQDAVYRSTTRKKMLPQKYNDQKFLHPHTVVRHFSKRLFYTPYPHTENIKQWHVSRMYHAFGYTAFDDIISEYMYLKGKFNHEYLSEGKN